MTQYGWLLSPGRIGSMEIRNRIMLAPMGTRLAQDGFVSQRTKDYYEARAQGGAGAIIVENATVDSTTGTRQSSSLLIDDDRFIPGMSELARVIKQHGARAVLQLHNGVVKLRPGMRPTFAYRLSPELTVADIEQVVARYALAAVRAKEAGFDALEILAAHSNTPSQFLSPAWNKRQDEYGGTPAKRAKFLVDVLRAIRTEVGEDYPLWCRINVAEPGLEGGLTFDETLERLPLFEATGTNAIHVSIAGFVDFRARHYVMCSENPGELLPYAAAIRKVVKVPVIVANRISPDLAERALGDGKADFVAMGRPLLADPELPNKLTSGKADEIRPCLACNDCVEIVPLTQGIECGVNATAGMEREYALTPATKAKRVLVAGGGPGGMEAARVAALRGHRVTLYEQEHEMGGQLVPAAIPPHKERVKPLIGYLANQMKKLDVRVELGKPLTPQEVVKVKPDVVILATGRKPLLPDINGLEFANVVTAEDVLVGKSKAGDNVIVIGGGLVGCETALFLAEKGKKVAIVEVLQHLATAMSSGSRTLILSRLAEKGVRTFTGVTSMQASASGLTFSIREGRDMASVEADTIVVAAGSAPNASLLSVLKDKVPEVYCIGDCVKPRGIKEAIHEGYHTARKL